MRESWVNGSEIIADSIELGREFKIGSNVRINVRGKFKIGNFSRFGNDVSINAENVEIGDHFFHYTPGLTIGGGGSQFPEANFKVGDRCVIHNNYVNICRAVTLGNDVGLSPDVDIITHGFWNSVLEGYPTKYESVVIDDGVIVGQRSMVLMGCYIAKNIVIGANSTVTKDLHLENSIYAGNPAKFIKKIIRPTFEECIGIMDDIVARYFKLITINTSPGVFEYHYPIIQINSAHINVETKRLTGTEDETTDKFRDYLRRYGIRIYTERPFESL
jgi:acetyltransferase-like isoleucine patch superfamily enzyme